MLVRKLCDELGEKPKIFARSAFFAQTLLLHTQSSFTQIHFLNFSPNNILQLKIYKSLKFEKKSYIFCNIKE